VAFRITWANGVECDFRFIKINSNQFENSKEQFHRFIFKKLLSFSSQTLKKYLATQTTYKRLGDGGNRQRSKPNRAEPT
jgi:hypothetical protein